MRKNVSSVDGGKWGYLCIAAWFKAVRQNDDDKRKGI